MKSFVPLTAPDPVKYENSSYYGFVPQRITSDSRYIYITFASSGEVFYGGMGAYACDTGSLSGGKVYRYRIENGVTVFDKDITPMTISHAATAEYVPTAKCFCYQLSAGKMAEI